jgi:hypothetical protein
VTGEQTTLSLRSLPERGADVETAARSEAISCSSSAHKQQPGFALTAAASA